MLKNFYWFISLCFFENKNFAFSINVDKFDKDLNALESLSSHRVRRNVSQPAIDINGDLNTNLTDAEFSNMKFKVPYSDFYAGPICGIVDVDNHPSHLTLLENCTIVTGYVKIVFINDYSDSMEDLDKYSFPKLRVITDYLLIYRVFGLKSLRKLFPNLTVIGGKKLFSIYALTIFENPDLTEIGLGSLRYILNGGVRIENNVNLCYLQTVDWNLLGSHAMKNNIVQNSTIINNDKTGCVDRCNNDSCNDVCWGDNICQSKCPEKCFSSCSDNLICNCHEECLGGCSAPNNASSCYGCKKYYSNSTCVKECPNNTLLLEGDKCITAHHCHNKIEGIEHESKCLIACPLYHRNVTRNGVKICEKCNGTCVKECTPEDDLTLKITTETIPDKFRRCTAIKGQLHISLSVIIDVQQLEDAFGQLEEVSAIVVQRSKFLKSLSFLKNLKRITGKQLYNPGANGDGYSIYILDNKNLRDLWNIQSGFKIDKGKAFFNFNPSLCKDKIDAITSLTTAVEDAIDVSLTTNGDRVTCTLTNIANVRFDFPPGLSFLSSPEATQSAVRISWDKPDLRDERTLIGYNIYYKRRINGIESESSPYDDPFDEERWNNVVNIDLSDLTMKNDTLSTLFTKFESFTNYSAYISTYTTAGAPNGARSTIYNFQTKPSDPSFPQSLTLEAINHSAILVSWEEPKFPNGRITGYTLSIENNNKIPEIKNGCSGKVTLRYNEQIPGFPNNPNGDTNSKNNQPNLCSNDRDDSKDKRNFMSSTDFEDFLIDSLIRENLNLMDPDDEFDFDEDYENDEDNVQEYLRKKRNVFIQSTRKFGRSSNISFVTKPTTITNRSNFTTSSLMESTNEGLDSFDDNKNVISIELDENARNYTVTGLDHFTVYSVDIIVKNHANKFSPSQSSSIRTKMLPDADKITSQVTSKKLDKGSNAEYGVDYLIKFDPPEKPNGIMIRYNLYVDLENDKQKEECCSAEDFEKDRGCKLSFTKQGKYKIKIVPQSLAGVSKTSVLHTIDVVQIATPNQQAYQSALIVVGVAVPLIIFILIFIYCKTKKNKQPPIYASVNPDYSSIGVYEPDEYEINEEDIKLLHEIGQGHFGKVYEGIAQRVVFGQSETRVAVKTMHGNETVSKRMEFLKEATVMKAFNSHHVVRLLGVVSRSARPMMVMEFMEKGDLKTYLRSVRPDAENQERAGMAPSEQRRLQMCGEIADGMAYLADNKFVHRDLAARNCLVHQDMTVKIGDFGLTRDIYETDYYRIDSKGILPVRWMAPESLKDGIFDCRSDVWSYGIVLWEIATLAEQPYQGKQHEEVTRLVIDGGYMEQPKNCPQVLYDLMLMCWHYSPGMRPTFLEIVSHLLDKLDDKFKEVSFFGEQQEVAERENEESTYANGSQLSTDGLLYYNGTNGKGDTVNADTNFRHLNGGRQTRESFDQGDVILENADDVESVRYVPNPVSYNQRSLK